MKRIILLAAAALAMAAGAFTIDATGTTLGFFDGDGTAQAAVADPGAGGCWQHDTLYNGWNYCADTAPAQDNMPDDGWAWSSPRGIAAPVNDVGDGGMPYCGWGWENSTYYGPVSGTLYTCSSGDYARPYWHWHWPGE
jgi:hypothetical protein